MRMHQVNVHRETAYRTSPVVARHVRHPTPVASQLLKAVLDLMTVELVGDVVLQQVAQNLLGDESAALFGYRTDVPALRD